MANQKTLISIKDLARQTNITTRTLRYYDSIDLLTPAETTEGGHRMYTEENTARLFKIIFLKDLGFQLNDIKSILDRDVWNWDGYFEEHFRMLQEERARLDSLERRMKEMKNIFELEGELEAPVLLELIKLSRQDPQSRHEHMKSLFNNNEIAHYKNLPNLSNDDHEAKEWLQKVADLKKLLNEDPASLPVQEIVAWIDRKMSEALGGDEQLMEKI
ncbi:MerR family transcriptional regulator [Brevibacillus daliensis]|uniref:MerR family transcriptional regulator n=1 Tax=Brevibacillus daliensis TaxID=2892995 RepID=UPI001E2BD251|nr:MerR family transcriptional regulator [Brevibacillus daliensis]